VALLSELTRVPHEGKRRGRSDTEHGPPQRARSLGLPQIVCEQRQATHSRSLNPRQVQCIECPDAGDLRQLRGRLAQSSIQFNYVRFAPVQFELLPGFGQRLCR